MTKALRAHFRLLEMLPSRVVKAKPQRSRPPPGKRPRGRPSKKSS